MFRVVCHVDMTVDLKGQTFSKCYLTSKTKGRKERSELRCTRKLNVKMCTVV